MQPKLQGRSAKTLKLLQKGSNGYEATFAKKKLRLTEHDQCFSIKYLVLFVLSLAVLHSLDLGWIFIKIAAWQC